MRSCRPTGAAQLPKETTVTRPAAHCHARQITQSQSHGKQKKESTEVKSVLSSFLDARPQGVAAQRKVGESQEGTGNLGVLSPFAPCRRVAAKRRSPSKGENPPSTGMVSTSPPASAPQYRRIVHALPRREKRHVPSEGTFFSAPEGKPPVKGAPAPLQSPHG